MSEKTATGTKAETKRNDILRLAAKLFDERGYQHTSMEDVAEAVGLRKPSLYHYYRSKDDILFFIHEQLADQLLSRQQRRQARPRLPADQELREIMGDLFEVLGEFPHHFRVFFESHRELEGDNARVVTDKRNAFRSVVEQAVQRAINEGAFRPVDAKVVTLGILGMCNWAYQWYSPEGELRPREIALTLWDVVVAGLRHSERL